MTTLLTEKLSNSTNEALMDIAQMHVDSLSYIDIINFGENATDDDKSIINNLTRELRDLDEEDEFEEKVQQIVAFVKFEQ